MVSSSGTAGRTVSASGRKKREWRRFWAQIRLSLHASIQPVMLAVCTFLLTFVRWFQIPSPFAASLLLAFADKPSPLALLGLGASLVLRLIWGIDPDWWQFAGCGLLWLVLQKCRPKAGVETAALGGLAMLPRIAASLMQGTQLTIVLSCAALPLAMLFSAAMRYGMDAVSQSGATARAMERFCMLLIVLLTVSGLGFFRIGSMNLGQMAAAAAVAVFAHLSGSVSGAAGGMLCGIALALGGHSSALTLPLGVLGLLGGLAGVKRRRWLMIPCALASAALSAFVSGGAPALGWWAAGMGAVVYRSMPPHLLDRLKPWLKGVEAGDRSMENAFVSQKIAHMRDAIERLARALPQCPTETLSAGEELGGVMCIRCSNRELCWGRSRERTESMLSRMMDLTQQGEMINDQTLPILAQHGCLHAQEAGEYARNAMVHRQRKRAVCQKARYERELTLTHLAALSGTLGELGTMAAGESYNDLRAAHLISLAIEELRMPARLNYARRVDGHLQAALEYSGMTPVKKQLDQLLHLLSKEDDLTLSVARAEKGRIELEEIPLYSASVGMASLNAEEAEVCGDAYVAKRCEGGRLLMMLCDGMGHGEQAHQQSEKTIELLLLLLEAGYTRHQAITAVNGMLLGSELEERYSTVDLADVDLWTGEVSSEKLGACASWIVRGNHMKKIEGSSLPLGILEDAQPTASQYRLHSGDILVLMSDGVADSFHDDAHFKQILAESLYIQPQRMADALLRNALIAGGGTPKDDMSVMVLLLMDRRNSVKA